MVGVIDTKGDIVTERVAEEKGLLGYVTDRTAKISEIKLAYIDPINEHPASIWIAYACKEIDQCGLSSSGSPNEGQ